MSRETKFRAWDKTNKVMCDVWDIGWKAWDYEGALNYIKVHAGDGTYDLLEPQVVLMQYTGLKDKHGKEIYEGDILQWTDGDGSVGRVYWMDGDACFETEPLLNGLSSAHATWYEVIGNIYESEKLGGGSEQSNKDE